MINKVFIFIVFLGLGFSSFCQITQSASEIYTGQAKERIRSYYSSLNLLTGNKLENEEKTTVIFETIDKMFENDQVYITNDIDLLGKTPLVFKNKEYLENIRMFYSNSEVSFRIDSMKVSGIYKANNFYFIKAEVFRELTVSFNDQQKKNTKVLDFYVKFIPGLLACQIYSIKNHEDNLGEFTKAKISTLIPNITQVLQDTVVERKPIARDPIVQNIPKIDSVKILNSIINKQSGKQTFWGISTLLMAGAGGYFMYESNQKYKEYQNSTSSSASDLLDTSKLYDKLGPAFLGVAGFCAIEFTLHSIKKGKAKNNLNLYKSRNSITLSYKF